MRDALHIAIFFAWLAVIAVALDHFDYAEIFLLYAIFFKP